MIFLGVVGVWLVGMLAVALLIGYALRAAGVAADDPVPAPAAAEPPAAAVLPAPTVPPVSAEAQPEATAA